MADEEIKKGKNDEGAETKKPKTVEVPESVLTKIQEQLASQEKDVEDLKTKNAGLEELLNKANTVGKTKLREKKTYEPKFRTVRIRKYPMAGDVDNLGYVVGWTSRGAYQMVDRSGIAPQIVDYIDLIFLGHEKNAENKPVAEQVKLLDFMNRGIQVHCKILESKVEPKEVPTGEEITVSVYDPKHGLVSTGETIDGFTCYSEIKHKIQIPSMAEPTWIDALYCNS